MVDSLDVTQILRTQAAGAKIFSGMDLKVSFSPWALTTAEWPLARVECYTNEQIASTVSIVNRCNVPFTVCGGREDVWGRNSRSGALVLDLSQMRKVVFNNESQFVEIQSGVTTGMLLEKLPPDVVVPTTVNKNVGVIGAALGGGYGMLSGRYGLTCDALQSAELITPTGDLIRVAANEYSELFRAIRGGGSGYGVVTSARFSTYPCTGVLAATLTLPLNHAVDALLRTQELLEAHPVDLGILPLFVKTADRGSHLILSFVWSGLERKGLRALEV